VSQDDDIVVFEHERDEVTVGDLREWHYIEVTCPVCGRVGRIYPTRLWKSYPMETRVADLARQFRCCRCWAKGSRRWNVLEMARNV
jgi:hypothetical protein